MKITIREKIEKFLFILLTAGLLALGNVLALTSTFALAYEKNIVFLVLFLITLLTALSIFIKYRRIYILILYLIFVCFIFYYRKGIYEEGIYALRKIYDLYQSYGIINLYPTLNTESITATLALCLLGGMLAHFYANSLVKGYGALGIVFVSLLYLAFCLPFNEYAPSIQALLCYCIALFLILFVNIFRKYDMNKRFRLGLVLVLPITIFSFLIVSIMHPLQYQKELWAYKIKDDVVDFADKHPIFEDPNLEEDPNKEGNREENHEIDSLFSGLEIWNNNADRLNLQDLGPRVFQNEEIFRVYLQNGRAGSYYFKSNSLGHYENSIFSSIDENLYAQYAIESEIHDEDYELRNRRFMQLGFGYISTLSYINSLSITTKKHYGTYFLPYGAYYMPREAQNHYDSFLVNPVGRSYYEYNFVPSEYGNFLYTDNQYIRFVYDAYLQIPIGLEEEISSTISEINGLMIERGITLEDKDALILLLQDYVKGIASYTTQATVPPLEKDFVAYFLEDATEGYCVHYATTLTMLMRIYGIPARYATGYYVKVSPYENSIAYDSDAHAWCEIFDEEKGWVAVEATPSASLGQTISENEREQETNPSQDVVIEEEENREENSEEKGIQMNRNVLVFLFLICLLLAIYGLRKLYIHKYIETKKNNQDYLRRYHYGLSIAKISGLPIDESIVDMAKKARFSQHEMIEEEYDKQDEWLKEIRDIAIKKNLFLSILMRIWY